VAACSRSAERTTGDASARADAELVIKVYVDDQGQIFVNGKQTTLPGLKEELSEPRPGALLSPILGRIPQAIHLRTQWM
jgi:hypothetical protein